MSSLNRANRHEGISLRQAALIAGFGYLLMPVAFAQLYVIPKLVIPGNIEQTVENILAHRGLLVTAILCYLFTFICDVVISWALYILLAPVNKSLSLLTAWFRLMYTALALFSLLNLVNVFRLLTSPDFLPLFGMAPLHAQIQLQLVSFQWDWSFSLILFGVHLGLLGWLIFRSGYIPRILGILLFIDGLAWIVDSLRPYLYPTANLGFLFIVYLSELIFMLWLLLRGWKILEPASQS
jgi:hypothetical protein